MEFNEEKDFHKSITIYKKWKIAPMGDQGVKIKHFIDFRQPFMKPNYTETLLL